jgi:hypothetical protein
MIKFKMVRLYYDDNDIEKYVEFTWDELIYEEDGSIIIPPPDNDDLA